MKFQFDINQKQLFEFEEILKSNGLSISSHSDLESISLDIIKCNKIYTEGITHNEKEDIRAFFSRVAGLVEIVRKILKQRNHPEFKQVIPHLELLNKSRSVPLTTISGVTDEANNKLFELYIGLLVMDFGANILLDDPKNAKGDNPDVLFDFQGKRWAIACKALHSKNEKTLYDTIEKGTDQINKSEAEKGIVIVNFKNIVDYNAFWPLNNEEGFMNGEFPEFSCYESIEEPIQILRSYGDEYREKLVETIELCNLKELSGSGKTENAFITFIQAVTAVKHEGICPATIIKTLNLIKFDAVTNEYYGLAENLNQAVHEML
jgi:hypothetical protein